MFTQLINPNPDIPCKPGWCLAYVNEAFGVPKKYGTATDAWNNSKTQHADTVFPSGVWFPVWFALANEPAGHVALMAPNGSVYSTSDYSTIPHRHPSLTDLMDYYARYGMTLTYRGWTEDVEDTPVIVGTTVNVQGTITTEEDDMFTEQDRTVLNSANLNADTARSEATNAKIAAREAVNAVTAISKVIGAGTNQDAVNAIVTEFFKRVSN